MLSSVGYGSTVSDPGTFRPPFRSPRTNVLFVLMLLCVVATFMFAVLTDGWVKMVAVLPAAFAVLLFVKGVKSDLDDDA